MRQRTGDLERLGAAAYVVSFERPERLRAYVRAHRVALPALVDPQRHAYRAYGLRRGAWWRIYGPRVLWGYATRMLCGARPQIHGDTLQEGGDFVVGADGRLRLAHVGQDPFDRPPVDELLRAMRE